MRRFSKHPKYHQAILTDVHEHWTENVANKMCTKLSKDLTPTDLPFDQTCLVSKLVQPITRQDNFRMVQIETDCRRHFKVHLK